MSQTTTKGSSLPPQWAKIIDFVIKSALPIIIAIGTWMVAKVNELEKSVTVLQSTQYTTEEAQEVRGDLGEIKEVLAAIKEKFESGDSTKARWERELDSLKSRVRELEMKSSR